MKKKIAKPKIKKEKPKKEKPKKEKPQKEKAKKYIEAVGRRKTSVARVRLITQGEKSFIIINGKKIEQYFPTIDLQTIAKDSLEKTQSLDKFGLSVMVKGGGLKAQAEAVRLGSARALALSNPNFKEELKKSGYLTRDPRMKERKKFGLKGARRAPQWSKR